MAVTKESNIKISSLAKEQKMKSGKELLEKLKELGYEEIKSTSSSISGEAFNALLASVKER